MARAVASPSPNPNAMKFTLDVTLPETMSFSDVVAAEGHPFAKAVFATGLVVSVFGVNDFVTVTRRPDADWAELVPAVEAAAATHL